MKINLLALALMIVAFTANAQTYCYDTNGDGEESVNDVMCLVNHLLGIPNPGEEPIVDLSCPDENHPHMVDLGLPSGTKWACCNVGTDKPEGYGGFYAWGETDEKTDYSWSTYIYCDGSYSTCHDLGNNISGTKYDVARVKWGGSWMIPSKEQIDELLDTNNCTHEATTLNGVKGIMFKSKTNSGIIFLPCSGIHNGSTLNDQGVHGCYWSGMLSTNNNSRAYYLGVFDDGYADWYNASRFYGHTVRPVAK